jgi:hypothetical protein
MRSTRTACRSPCFGLDPTFHRQFTRLFPVLFRQLLLPKYVRYVLAKCITLLPDRGGGQTGEHGVEVAMVVSSGLSRMGF